ncbi:O-antigen ligase family protein [Haliea sp. E17]|uniref:O-antigen ligase family protein n=1 Tax=Haliea sp. E17 TaxID=3401576 RepID=UPI003AB04CFB
MSSRSCDSERVLFYAFLGLLVWLPLPWGSNRPWSWSLMEICTALLTLGVLALFVAGRLKPSAAFRAAWPVLVCLALVCLWIRLQAVALPPAVLANLSPGASGINGVGPGPGSISLERFATRVDLGLTLAYLQLFGLTLLLVTSRERVKALLAVLVLGGVFQAAYGTFLTLSGFQFDYVLLKEVNTGAATGTYINRNHLAGYLEMTLALGIGMMVGTLQENNRRASSWRQALRRGLRLLLSEKVRLRVYLTVMVIGLVMTRSRMGNSAFFISLTLAVVYWVIASGRLSRGTLLLFASLLVVDIWVVGNFFGIHRVVERLEATSLASEQRDEVAFDTLAAIADYPLTGTGAGSFYAIFPLYQRGEVEPYYDHAHNDYAEFAVELGLPATALLGVAAAASLWAALAATRRRRDRLLRGLGLGASMGMVSLLIHSVVDFNLQIPANAALFVVLMALGWVSLHLGRGHPARSPAPAREAAALV